jgi:lipopolysaccharide transport system ATP-binding protein
MKLISKVIRPTIGYTLTRGRVGALLEVSAGFHPELTGRENALLKGSAMGMSRAEVRAALDSIIEFADLSPFIDTPIKYYSSGMTMRLGFAVAAKMRPDIFLVDEAFAVGDRAFQEKCLTELEAIVQEGSTVLVVSHIMAHITRLCGRALWLHQGQAQLLGEVKTVAQAYLAATMPSSLANPMGVQGGYFQSPPDPRKPMSITEAALLNTQGQVSQRMEWGQPFRLRLTYVIHQEEIGHIGISIHSEEEGGRAIYSSDAESNPAWRGLRQPGRYEAEVEIPAQLLNVGHYQLSVNMGVPYVITHDYHQNVITFEVVDSSQEATAWYGAGRRPGIIGTPLKWHYLGDPPVG